MGTNLKYHMKYSRLPPNYKRGNCGTNTKRQMAGIISRKSRLVYTWTLTTATQKKLPECCYIKR